MVARLARMIRINALWLSVGPLDMRAGMGNPPIFRGSQK